VRRHFNLPQEDDEFLNSKGLLWETLIESNLRWLVIHDYSIPEGYNTNKASVALMLNGNYPLTQIDMIYFNPGLSKQNGNPIAALTYIVIAGQQWQRWSRHRTAANPWIPGEDNVSSHLAMFDLILKNELSR